MTITDDVNTQESAVIAPAILRVGADIGNGNVKLAIDPVQARALGVTLAHADGRLIMPSAIGSEHQSAQKLFNSNRVNHGDYAALSTKLGYPVRVYQENALSVEYFVGTAALDHARDASTARGDDQRYYDGWSLRLLVTALDELCPGTEPLTVAVHTGVPYAFWSDNLDAKIHHSLVGTHTCMVNGRARTITIAYVAVTVEGEAALRALGLAKDETVFVLDIGAHTANYGIYKEVNGDLLNSASHSGSETLGIEEMLDRLDTVLMNNRWRALKPAERTGLLTALRHGQLYKIIVGSQQVEISKAAQTVFAELLKDLLRNILRKVNLSWVQRRIMVGGGAYFLFDLLNTLVGAELVFERPATPEHLNAEGYLVQMQAIDVVAVATKRKVEAEKAARLAEKAARLALKVGK